MCISVYTIEVHGLDTRGHIDKLFLCSANVFFICPGVILCYLAVIIAKKYVFVFRNIPVRLFTHNIRWGPSPYLYSCRLSGRNLPGLPSRDSNSGLPYSKPAHYQLSCAAPSWAALHPTELRCTDFYVSWHLRFVTFTFRDIYVFWRFRFVYYTFCDAIRFVTLYLM